MAGFGECTLKKEVSFTIACLCFIKYKNFRYTKQMRQLNLVTQGLPT